MNVEDTTTSPEEEFNQDEPEGMYSSFVGANAGYVYLSNLFLLFRKGTDTLV